MTKKSRERKSPSGSGKSSEAGAFYPVGYGKPPQHSQFKKGVSGNSKGRPKGRLNLGTVLQTELDRPITIREGTEAGSSARAAPFS
jgi:hypothetical protein